MDENIIKTWSVKLDEDTKTEIQQLINNSGQQGKDFMQTLISAYKINKVKEANPSTKADIEELQYHTQRVQDIYYNLTSRVDAKIKDIAQQHIEEIDTKEQEIINLNSKINELKEDLNTSNNDREEINKLYQGQLTKIKELELAKTTSEDLTMQYKEKIDTLNSQLNIYKNYKEENELISKELQDKIEIIRQTQNLLDLANNQITTLEKQNIEQASIHNNELKQLEDILNLESEKTSIRIEKHYQEQIQIIRDDYNRQIKDFLQEMHNQQQQMLAEKVHVKIDDVASIEE